DLNYGLAPIPKGTVQATYGVTDTIMIFKDSEHKEEAWKFLEEAAFSDKNRIAFSEKEGFLPVMKAEAAAPVFADDPQLKAFTEMLPYAKFAPLIPNWEAASDTASAALQQIYQGQAEPEAALTDAAAKIDELIQQ
ncbi:MAG TPA: extracellular solute-binding protein, partial [Geminicoccus sp.]|uniref:extracellular solute-binding protein n=1 Tax=Geminicoccus sp. TaxID=2024832 RepID=UPI002CC5311C